MYHLDEKTIYFDSSEELIISSKQKSKSNLPPFQMVGRKYIKGNKTMGYDYTGVLLSLNKEEQWFYTLIRQHINFRTNEAIILSSSLTATEKVKASKAYKSLNSKGLLKKVKKENYLVNPDAVIYPPNYENIKLLWDSI